ncbi:hypothetical protein ACJQWK_01572 [Exserohilum turcicum]
MAPRSVGVKELGWEGEIGTKPWHNAATAARYHALTLILTLALPAQLPGSHVVRGCPGRSPIVSQPDRIGLPSPRFHATTMTMACARLLATSPSTAPLVQRRASSVIHMQPAPTPSSSPRSALSSPT